MNRLSRLLLVAFLSAPLPVMAQTDTAPRTITCEDAIAIALGESYTVMSYLADLESMEHSFAYNQAQFKPRLDFSMFAPRATRCTPTPCPPAATAVSATPR